eukprot:a683755_11.p1 GENE.a683755_11~~a683755_11.p1  ORF type:complete len:212 (+),score=47.85 a683755_11:47-637(+)
MAAPLEITGVSMGSGRRDGLPKPGYSKVDSCRLLLQRGSELYALPYAKPPPGSRPLNDTTMRRRALDQPNERMFSTVNRDIAKRKRQTTQGPATALHPRPVTAPALDKPTSLYRASYRGTRPVSAGAGAKPLGRFSLASPRNRLPEAAPKKPAFNASSLSFGPDKGPRVKPRDHFATEYRSSFVAKATRNRNAYKI